MDVGLVVGVEADCVLHLGCLGLSICLCWGLVLGSDMGDRLFLECLDWLCFESYDDYVFFGWGSFE